MPRRPLEPAALKRGPFSLHQALREGLSREQLRGASWNRIGRGTYVWAGLAGDPLALLAGAALRLPPTAVFSGLTAAWLHGLDVEPCSPIEVTIPHTGGISARTGIAVSRAAIAADEITVRRSFRCATIPRAVSDVSIRLPLVEAVVVADMAIQDGLTSIDALRNVAATTARPGTRRFRKVAALAAVGAESPMETRLRVQLVLDGLPRPETQVEIYDAAGDFIARVDLFYPDVRLALEYDGEHHLDRDRLTKDHRRQNRLLASNVSVLRFTAADVRERRQGISAEVRAERARLKHALGRQRVVTGAHETTRYRPTAL